MADNDSTPWLTPGQEDDSSGWIALDLGGLASTRDDPPLPIPFRLFARRVKSSSPDSEWFLHDPLMVLKDLVVDDDGTRIEDDWQVTTFVVNHHRTLSKIHLFTMAVVAPAEKTVALTLYKQPEA
jgi:hypothetical protein